MSLDEKQKCHVTRVWKKTKVSCYMGLKEKQKCQCYIDFDEKQKYYITWFWKE